MEKHKTSNDNFVSNVSRGIFSVDFNVKSLIFPCCITPHVIQCIMIKSFKDKEAQGLFLREASRKLPPDLQRAALRKLQMLNRAQTLEDLRIPPGNRLEALTGDGQGQYSIRINNRWRICFIWKETNAHEVEIVDYH